MCEFLEPRRQVGIWVAAAYRVSEGAWLLLKERWRKRRGISGAVCTTRGSGGSRTSAGGRASTSTFSAAARRLCFSGSRVTGGFFSFKSLFPFFHVFFKETKSMCSLVVLSFRPVGERTFLKFLLFWGGILHFARWHNACSFPDLVSFGGEC